MAPSVDGTHAVAVAPGHTVSGAVISDRGGSLKIPKRNGPTNYFISEVKVSDDLYLKNMFPR